MGDFHFNQSDILTRPMTFKYFFYKTCFAVVAKTRQQQCRKCTLPHRKRQQGDTPIWLTLQGEGHSGVIRTSNKKALGRDWTYSGWQAQVLSLRYVLNVF